MFSTEDKQTFNLCIDEDFSGASAPPGTSSNSGNGISNAVGAVAGSSAAFALALTFNHDRDSATGSPGPTSFGALNGLALTDISVFFAINWKIMKRMLRKRFLVRTEGRWPWEKN